MHLLYISTSLIFGTHDNAYVQISIIEKSEFESFVSYRETICIQSLSQFAVVKAHNFQIVTGPGKSGHYRDVALGDVST